jgi:hypothetical protein
MKPHSKIRKTLKWGRAFGWGHGGVETSIEWGHVEIGYTPGRVRPSSEGFWALQLGPAFPKLPPSYWWHHEGSWNLSCPLWVPAIAAAISSLVAGRLDIRALRRARVNVCPKCNYDPHGDRGGYGVSRMWCAGVSGVPSQWPLNVRGTAFESLSVSHSRLSRRKRRLLGVQGIVLPQVRQGHELADCDPAGVERGMGGGAARVSRTSPASRRLQLAANSISLM